jgi:hypothetical protein
MPVHHLSPYGTPKYSGGSAVNASVATVAALKALADGAPERVHGNEIMVDADQSRWYFHSTSTLTGDDILVVAPTAGSGRWLRVPGAVRLRLPIAFGTADGATLLTLQAGQLFKLESAHWQVTTAFAGGSSSAIGLAATGSTTAGDILGGAAGDVEATLTAGVKAGTVGAKMDSDSELHAQLFVATNTFTFERITSAFTSGAGYAVLVGFLLSNDGA